MAFCAKCGNQMDEGTQFCPSCGTKAGAAPSAQPSGDSKIASGIQLFSNMLNKAAGSIDQQKMTSLLSNVTIPNTAAPPSAPSAAPPRPPQPQTEKVGNIRKCPACGAETPSMTAVCPQCGHEFRGNSEISSSVQRFVDMVNQAENHKHSFGGLRGGDALETISVDIHALTSVISNFVIPNTREDLIEAMLFMAGKIRQSAGLGSGSQYKKERVRLWVNKAQEVYDKAKIVMPNEVDKLEGFVNAVEEGKNALKKMKSGARLGLILGLGIPLLVASIITYFVLKSKGIL